MSKSNAQDSRRLWREFARLKATSVKRRKFYKNCRFVRLHSPNTKEIVSVIQIFQIGCLDLLFWWQVETYGSMEKKEKVEFILEQMRLCLAKRDYIRTQIISKKVSLKFFDDKDTHASCSISKHTIFIPSAYFD